MNHRHYLTLTNRTVALALIATGGSDFNATMARWISEADEAANGPLPAKLAAHPIHRDLPGFPKRKDGECVCSVVIAGADGGRPVVRLDVDGKCGPALSRLVAAWDIPEEDAVERIVADRARESGVAA